MSEKLWPDAYISTEEHKAALAEKDQQNAVLTAEVDAWRNVIATICRDGGQYHQQHGTEATKEFCIKTVCDERQQLDAVAAELAQAKERAGKLEDALWQHRIDLHQSLPLSSPRPCLTCAKSAAALGITGANAIRCMRPHENEAARKALAPQPTAEAKEGQVTA